MFVIFVAKCPHFVCFFTLLMLCFDVSLNLLIFSFMIFCVVRKSVFPTPPKKIRICLKWKVVPSSRGRAC